MTAWKFSDIGRLLRNSFIAVLKGEFLLRLNVGKYFVHVMYTFLLFAVIIWLSLMTESTMARVEEAKAVLKELEIENSELTYEAAKAERRTTVEARLKALGSEVAEPMKPAVELEPEDRTCPTRRYSPGRSATG